MTTVIRHHGKVFTEIIFFNRSIDFIRNFYTYTRRNIDVYVFVSLRHLHTGKSDKKF